MSIELFDKILKIVEDIHFTITSKFNISPNNTNFSDVEQMTYSIYLISIGFIPGVSIFNNYYFKVLFNRPDTKTATYNDIFNNTENIKYISKILAPLKTIDNISFYIGALSDISKKKDTIYIYNTNLYSTIEKVIIKIENINKLQKKTMIISTLIAKLYGYDIVNYKDIYDKGIVIDFVLHKSKKSILGYFTYKHKLASNWDKLLELNKCLKPLRQSCYITLHPDP
jgi:hypothetical protein